MPRSWRVSLEFEPRDLWVGAYWKRERKPQGELLSVRLCGLPCLPLVITCLAYGETEGRA